MKCGIEGSKLLMDKSRGDGRVWHRRKQTCTGQGQRGNRVVQKEVLPTSPAVNSCSKECFPLDIQASSL